MLYYGLTTDPVRAGDLVKVHTPSVLWGKKDTLLLVIAVTDIACVTKVSTSIDQAILLRDDGVMVRGTIIPSGVGLFQRFLGD